VRRRLLASYLSITLFVLIALGLPLGVSYANTEHRRLANDVQQDASAFVQRAGVLVDDDAAAARDKLDMVVDGFARDMDATVVITDAAGEVVVASPGSRTAASTPAMALAQRGVEVTDTFADPRLGSSLGVALPVVVGGQIEGAVLVARAKAPTEHRIQNNWLLLAALGGVIALVVLLVSTLLARSFTKPLVDLDRGAARLGEGDLAVRVEVPSDPPELSGLARSVNATAERLEATRSRRDRPVPELGRRVHRGPAEPAVRAPVRSRQEPTAVPRVAPAVAVVGSASERDRVSSRCRRRVRRRHLACRRPATDVSR